MSLRVSARSWALLLGGFVVVALIATLIAMGVGGESGVIALSDFGELFVVGVSAVWILWVSKRLGTGSVGRPWLLIGLGVLAFAIGDAVWTYFEVIRAVEPAYPGPPDLFYMIEYPLVAAGVLSAGLAYRSLVDLKRPAITAAALALVAAAVMWFGLIAPHVLSQDLPAAEKFVSAYYPLADVLLLFGPAVFVALVVGSLGRGILAWPWRTVAAGVVVLALADAGYSWLQTYNLYESGSFIDYGWSIGMLLMAFGSALALDIARPTR